MTIRRESLGAGLLALALALSCGTTKSDPTGERESGGTPGGGGTPAAAGIDECPAGSEGCACYGNDTCDDDLACASSLCVVLPGSGGSAGGSAGGTGGSSAGGAGGSSTGGAGGTNASGAGGSSGGGATSTGGAGIGGRGGAGAAPSRCALEPDAGCVARPLGVAPRQLAVYFMFDVSCSMSCSVDESGCCDQYASPAGARIVPVREAIRQFVEDEANAGTSVGLGFFGDHDVTDSALVNSPELCSVEAHSDATVEIASLPANASAFVDGLYSVEPQGGTPTQFAILGACEQVSQWHAAHPGVDPVVVLVTDGIPESACNATFDVATQAAAQCFDGGAGYHTYVLGIDANDHGLGGSLEQLNDLASAAGTDQAYLTDANDLEQSTLQALNQIVAAAGEPGGCSYSLESIDAPTNLNLFNVGLCAEALEVIPRRASSATCGTDHGWYFDDPNGPSLLSLCDASCDVVRSSAADPFFIEGCQTLLEL